MSDDARMSVCSDDPSSTTDPQIKDPQIGVASAISIEWTQNPLAAIVRPGEEATRLLRAPLQRDILHGLIRRACLLLYRGNVSAAREVLDRSECVEAEETLADYLEALQQSHCGDCTCEPVSCIKCEAEAALGIRTLAGLTKYAAHQIQSAFGERGDRSLDDAIAALASYDPTPWPNHEDLWRQHLPRWREEVRQAHAWLVRYRDDHFLLDAEGHAAGGRRG